MARVRGLYLFSWFEAYTVFNVLGSVMGFFLNVLLLVIIVQEKVLYRWICAVCGCNFPPSGLA